MQFDPLKLAQPQVQQLSPYLPGISEEAVIQAHGVDPAQIIKLNSNENPHGPSPKALTAIAQAAAQSHRYPDNQTLAEAVAAKHQVKPDQIVLGNGSTEIIDMVARTFLGPNTQAVSSQYAFAMFRVMTHLCGAKNIIVPAKDYAHNLEAMLTSVTPQTHIVWIANPNNPTGTFLPYSFVKSFLENLPADKILVLDEAYFDYLDDETQVNSADWLKDHPNLIILRTFSKIHGLAGLRVGYGVTSPQIAGLLNRVKQPLNINNAGMSAALAALQDEEFTGFCRQQNRAGLQQLKEGFDQLGIEHLPSFGNFITAKLAGRSTVQDLLRQGIILRPLDGYDLPDYARITVGKTEENSRLLQVLGG